MIGIKSPLPGRPDENLDRLLKNYQQLAMNTLGGPSNIWRQRSRQTESPARLSYGSSSHTQPKQSLDLPFDFKLPFLPPLGSLPLFYPRDSVFDLGDCELVDCELDGRIIPSFSVSGEKRLCLPVLMRTVLKDREFPEITAALTRLHINTSLCSQRQLHLLKYRTILPAYVGVCHLITLSDAERLCTDLLDDDIGETVAPSHRSSPISESRLPVYHECFGEGHGYLLPEKYVTPHSRCIVCTDCDKLFSTERFVTHSHSNQEIGVVHWGFNRQNWRSYLLLEEAIISPIDLESLEVAFTEALDKFASESTHAKEQERRDSDKERARRLSAHALSVSNETTEICIPIKRRCTRVPTRAVNYEHPALTNPDCAIAASDSHLYEKHFVPNVCLKPESPGKVEEEALDLTSPRREARSNNLQHSPLIGTEVVIPMPPRSLSPDEIDVTSPDEEEEEDMTSMASGSVLPHLQEMKELFTRALNGDDLCEEERIETKRRYCQLHDLVAGRISN